MAKALSCLVGDGGGCHFDWVPKREDEIPARRGDSAMLRLLSDSSSRDICRRTEMKRSPGSPTSRRKGRKNIISSFFSTGDR